MSDNVDLPSAQSNHELVGKNDLKVFMFYGKCEAKGLNHPKLLACCHPKCNRVFPKLKAPFQAPRRADLGFKDPPW